MAVEWKTLLLTDNTVRVLNRFLDPFTLPRQSKFSNVVNQVGKSYYIPTRQVENPEADLDFEQKSFTRPIDQFFSFIDECRRRGVVLNFCEQQWHHEPMRIIKPMTALERAAETMVKTTPAVTPNGSTKAASTTGALTYAFADDELDEVMQDEDNASIISAQSNDPSHSIQVVPLSKEELQQVYTPNQMKVFPQTTHIGVWLDFDIYQRDSVRKLDDAQYIHIIQEVCGIIRDTIDFESCRNPAGVVEKSRNGTGLECKVYAAVLRKSDVRQVSHSKYGNCYKESFHIRIPTLRITRGFKVYLIKRMKEKGIVQAALSNLQLLNPIDEILDKGVVSGSPMIIGCAKRDSTEPHQVYKLYQVNIRSIDAFPIVTPCREFDPIENPETGNTPLASKVGRKKAAKPIPRYRWNIAHELSLIHEAPEGLIKKRDFEPKAQLAIEINSLGQRDSVTMISDDDINMVDRAVQDLCARDEQALFISKCLMILDQDRAEAYHKWLKVIIILAKENPEYKCLAIQFSQRSPKWASGGSASLEKIWNWALNNPDKKHESEDGDEMIVLRQRNIGQIEAWARQDSPDKFDILKRNSAYHELLNLSNTYAGKLNDTHIADVLHKLFGNVFLTDKIAGSYPAKRVWYSFVTPTNNIRSHKSMYKWRDEADKPDTFDDCLCRTFTVYLDKIIGYFQTQETKAEKEEVQKHFQDTISNLKHLQYTLGQGATITRYIQRASVIFRRDDFIENLDRADNVIGTMNGVLVLSPKTELVQGFNDYCITRSCTCDYVPFDPSNPYKQAISAVIQELFAGEWDAMEFTMCYLASGMDHKRKTPLLFIWLGGGANGKSFLLEMFIKMLGDVTRGGYGYKLNASFFTAADRIGGTDTQKMQLEFARMAYASETNEMDKLHTSKIKEVTSDTVSGNDKYKTQTNFDVNTRLLLATNYATRVEGNDHGIWRRLVVYWFKMTFKENPNPENPRERPMRPEILEVWPKDRNYKMAFLSYMMDWYERYRDVYGSNILKIKRPTIDKESLEFRQQSDIMSKFIHQTLEFVGPSYVDEEDPNKPTVEVQPIKLVEVVARYQDWHRANVDKDPPPGMVITNNIIKYPEIEKYLAMVDNSNMQYLTQHIMHNIGETWKHKKKEQKRNEGDAMGPLTQGEGVVVPEIGLPVPGDGPRGSKRPQLSDIASPLISPPMLKVVPLKDLSQAPPAIDDESQELKIMYPEFNKPEVNEILRTKLVPKERREMDSRIPKEGAPPVSAHITREDNVLPDDVDPLNELDARVEQHSSRSRKGTGTRSDNVQAPILEELDLDGDLDPNLSEATARELVADLTYKSKKAAAKFQTPIRNTHVKGAKRSKPRAKTST